MQRPDDPAHDHRVHRGPLPAMEDLVRAHGAYLFTVARALVRDEQEAEDVVQETWLAALRGEYRGDAALRTWLVAILVRQAALLRRRHRPWLRLWRNEESPPEVPDHRPRPDRNANARMDLATMLSQLEPAHREVIVLRELEQMSYEQIAAVLGVPRGTVESRLFRARQQLRSLWEESS